MNYSEPMLSTCVFCHTKYHPENHSQLYFHRNCYKLGNSLTSVGNAKGTAATLSANSEADMVHVRKKMERPTDAQLKADAAAMAVDELAKKYGRTKSTVYNWLSMLRASELEAEKSVSSLLKEEEPVLLPKYVSQSRKVRVGVVGGSKKVYEKLASGGAANNYELTWHIEKLTNYTTFRTDVDVVVSMTLMCGHNLFSMAKKAYKGNDIPFLTPKGMGVNDLVTALIDAHVYEDVLSDTYCPREATPPPAPVGIVRRISPPIQPAVAQEAVTHNDPAPEPAATVHTAPVAPAPVATAAEKARVPEQKEIDKPRRQFLVLAAKDARMKEFVDTGVTLDDPCTTDYGSNADVKAAMELACADMGVDSERIVAIVELHYIGRAVHRIQFDSVPHQLLPR